MSLTGDHPRVCGNYIFIGHDCYSVEGSPPRVRELRLAAEVKSRLDGITPACAGITHRLASCKPNRWDHPRVCGNYAGDAGGYARA